MHFTCTYCEKPINGVALLIDKTHFLHQGCEEAFKNENKKTFVDFMKEKLEEQEKISDAIKKGTLSNLVKKRNIKFFKAL